MEVTKTIKISLDDIKEDIGQSEALELLDHVNDYSSDFYEKVIDKLGISDDILLENISSDYLGEHIANNLNYYKCTSKLIEEISDLKHEIENPGEETFETKFQEAIDSNNKEQAKRYLCDLFDLGYHSNGELAKKISELIK